MDDFLRSARDRAENIIKHCAELDELISSPEIIADTAFYLKICRQRQTLERCFAIALELCDRQDFALACIDDANVSASEREKLEEQLFTLADALAVELSSNKDYESVLLQIRPRANATELVGLLESIYTNLSRRNAWECEILHDDSKCVSLLICGKGTREVLLRECGIHRMESINGSSEAVVYVLEYDNFSDKYNFDRRNLRIDYFHSSGAGGQNVNKVETAVRVTHLPSGITVTCQDERSQLKNKRRAMDTICRKLEEMQQRERNLALESQRKAIEKKCLKQPCRIYDVTKALTYSAGTQYPLAEILDGSSKVFVEF